ncbi:MAG: N-acetyltransferase [Sedimentisphaerales bacterium]|nr:N-acetyltransferase [Sedimentisphaerales bacterium]
MIRNAQVNDVPAIHDLINEYAEQGLMLFRSLADLYESLRDFVVCQEDSQIVGCCGLQIYWRNLAEIKSLAVRPDCRGRGIGRGLIESQIQQARQLKLPRLFVLTLEKEFFERVGFVQIPMDSLPHKVWSDCVRCPKQDNCDEIAMQMDL